jgi:nitrogen fixation protein NifX
MIRVAFASNDQTQVNLHFGAAESFVVYDIAPGEAELVGIGEFVRAEMKGINNDKALPKDYVPVPESERKVNTIGPNGEIIPVDKVGEKLEFLKDCVAVYAASIGQSSIKRLMTAGIQPIIVDNGRDIVELLNEISIAMSQRGELSWVDRALAKNKAADRFDSMEDEGWGQVA